MPMLVRSPEQIFRAEKKDIYLIRSLEERYESNAPGLVMIRKWIEDNLPETRTELLAPSEYSGVILGGIGRELRVDFSPEGLQRFCERWEKNDKSVDDRFQCYLWPYDRWYQKHGRFAPTREKPQGIGLTVWWYTPLGFIHHQLPASQAGDLQLHPARPDDLWFHVPDLWPELAALDPETMTSGSIGHDSASDWYAIYRPPFGLRDDDPARCAPTPDEIRHWFGLPDSVEIVEWED